MKKNYRKWYCTKERKIWKNCHQKRKCDKSEC